ncbi:MAG TPA: HAD-IC family P-type ATPase [Crenalkalicoccus sp.]|nr:HAD-IC family P-type ATPase [Crenalkalicoccus sp.]
MREALPMDERGNDCAVGNGPSDVLPSPAPENRPTARMAAATGAASEARGSATAVTPLHTAVAGRARLQVAGLHRSTALKSALERGLAALPGVHSAAANPRTGNLLVHHDPDLVPVATIIDRAGALARGEVQPPPEEALAGGSGGADWAARDAAAVAEALGTDPTSGLPTEDARARLAEVGPNAFPKPPAHSALGMLLGQFANLPVGLLAGAAAVSMVTGGALEAVAILAVVVLNGAIGFGVESRSERTIRSLDDAGDRRTRVLRDGIEVEIPVEAVVPGDLLPLRRGTLVAADARVVSAQDLTVSEALLTGESQPVRKTPHAVHGSVALGERRGMVHRGTVVTGGSGMAIAVATGPRTEMGRIQRLAGGAATPQTPMQRQLEGVGSQVVWLVFGISGAVFGVGLLRGFAVLQMVRSAVSLAVAAVPEALPTVATTTLALGVEEMRRRDVLVRRLDAVETLASVGLICFDKTGTLTLNRMSVTAIALDVGDAPLRIGEDHALPELRDGAPAARQAGDLRRLIEIGVLCSEAQVEERGGGRPPAISGSGTESALVQLALEAGLDPVALRRRHPRLGLRQRTETYRFMASIHRRPGSDDDALLAVKGSPEEVLAHCTWRLQQGERYPLTEADRAAIGRANAAMAGEALRVLGFAFRDDAPLVAGNGDVAAEGLTWVGLAGMADPVRPGVAALMRTLHGAGVHALMMTGDQVPTARAVARELGLAPAGEQPEVLDAVELERLAPGEVAAVARRAHVLARVSPAQKLQVILALQEAGLVVAMIGDGINDSPALKAADVGIAMGRDGTEAAREVADVVLQTDDLATLAVAIERGRATYGNVRRSIRYLLGTNLSEIGVVLAGTAAGIAEPLSVAQLLWINLVTDILPGLGLALEPPAPGLMLEPPRPAEEAVLRGQEFAAVAGDGAVLALGPLLACGFGVLRHGVGPEARTMTFGSLITAQLMHTLSCRPGAGESRPRPPNPALAAALGVSAAAQGAALLVPGLRRLLGIAPLGPLGVAVTLGAGMLPYAVNRALRRGRTTGSGAGV